MDNEQRLRKEAEYALRYRAINPLEKLAEFFESGLAPGPELGKLLAAAIRGMSEPPYMNLSISRATTGSAHNAARTRWAAFAKISQKFDHAKKVFRLAGVCPASGLEIPDNIKDQYANENAVTLAKLKDSLTEYRKFACWIKGNEPDWKKALGDDDYLVFLRGEYHFRNKYPDWEKPWAMSVYRYYQLCRSHGIPLATHIIS